MKEGFVYILSNKNKTVLYIGATRILKERVERHISGEATQFTKKYNINELLCFEYFSDYSDVFVREKQLKKWHKEWKWNLIKSKNPRLKNLYLEL